MNIDIKLDKKANEICEIQYGNFIKADDIIQKIIQNTCNIGFNVSNLREIYLLHDYFGGLEKFQQINGLNKDYTHNEIRTGTAMTIPLIKNGQLEHYILIDFKILEVLFLNEFLKNEILRNIIIADDDYNENTTQKAIKQSLNTIYHELCHVNDNNNLIQIFGSNSFDFESNCDAVLYKEALDLWSEYYSHFMSMKLSPIDVSIDSLKSDLIFYEETIKEQLYQDVNYCYKLVKQYLEYSIREIGNFYGCELGDDLLLEKLEGTLIHKYVLKISIEFKKLFSLYPNWNHYESLNNLVLIINNIWKDFGLDISKLTSV